MEQETVIVELKLNQLNQRLDIEIPLDITVHELVTALAEIFGIPVQSENIGENFIRTEYPIGFYKGNKKLSDCNIMNGTIINF